MALGISERLLEKAYGPQDFSYVYNKIDEVQKRQAAEQRLRDQEAQKIYYSNLSDINKQRAGAREVDIPEIMDYTSKWSNIEKVLSSNPNLIRNNPEQYYKLKQESDNLFSKALTTIRGSKEMSRFEKDTLAKMSDPRNIDYYSDGAPSLWKKNVISQPLSRIRENATDDVSRYYETQINGKDFYNTLPAKIALSFQPKEIEDPTFKGAPGERKVIRYDKMPDIGSMFDQIDLSLNANMGKKSDKFALQQLEKAVESKDYQNTIAQFEDFFDERNQEGAKKYGIPSKKPFDFNPEGSPRQEFVKYMTAREFLSRVPSDGVAKIGFPSPSDKMRYGASLRKEGAAPKPVKEIKGLDEEFSVIAKGGQTGVDMAKRTSDYFNSIGFAEQMYPFTIASNYQNEPVYSTGTELASADLEKLSSIGDPKKNVDKLSQAAETINKKNKERGFLDSDVTPDALRSGKIMILSVPDASGKSANVYLNAGGKNSLRYINRRVKAPQMTAGEKRGAVGTGVEAADTEARKLGL